MEAYTFRTGTKFLSTSSVSVEPSTIPDVSPWLPTPPTPVQAPLATAAPVSRTYAVGDTFDEDDGGLGCDGEDSWGKEGSVEG